MELKTFVCVICQEDIDHQKDETGKIFWTGGHNALPVSEGQCCSACNTDKVIPERIKQSFAG